MKNTQPKQPFSLLASIQWWSKKTQDSVRQHFNFDLYQKILKAKMK